MIFVHNSRLYTVDVSILLPYSGYSSRYVNRMLGITLTNHLSVSDHVRDVISRCTQSLHALKIMRCHGMNSEALKTVLSGARQAPTLLPSGGALQPHQTKVGLKHTYDARFGSICIKTQTLTPLRHNLLRTPMTLCSKTF